MRDTVRLVGLSSVHLNGAIGTVTSELSAEGRIGVLLYGEQKSKGFRPINLSDYFFSDQDVCTDCKMIINLDATRVCGCTTTACRGLSPHAPCERTSPAAAAASSTA